MVFKLGGGKVFGASVRIFGCRCLCWMLTFSQISGSYLPPLALLPNLARTSGGGHAYGAALQSPVSAADTSRLECARHGGRGGGLNYPADARCALRRSHAIGGMGGRTLSASFQQSDHEEEEEITWQLSLDGLLRER